VNRVVRYIDTQLDILQGQCDALSSPSGLLPNARQLLERHDQLKALIARKSDLETMRTQYVVNCNAADICRSLMLTGRGDAQSKRGLELAEATLRSIEEELFKHDPR